MAFFSTAARQSLNSAIRALVSSSAYETPFSADVIERVAPSVEATGFMSRGAFAEAVKLNPVSTLLKWIAFVDDIVPVVFITRPSGSEQLFGVFTLGEIPGVTDMTFIGAVTVAGIAAENTTSLRSVSAPNLQQIDPSGDQSGVLDLVNNVALVTVDFPKLNYMGGSDLTISGNSVLPAVSFPALGTVMGNFAISDNASLSSVALPKLVSSPDGIDLSTNPSLVSVDLSRFIPTDGTALSFGGDALSAATVALIFRRCALAGVVTCSVDTSGGTSAGIASLSAQGQADYAALVAAGNNITPNP